MSLWPDREPSDPRDPWKSERSFMATVAVGPTDQAMHALEQANRVRSVRAQVKREIASGSLSASAVIERCPREAEGMTVRELLQSQPRWGPTRCSRLALSAGVSEGRAVGALTARQRSALIEGLDV
jgi:hypothetical protein